MNDDNGEITKTDRRTTLEIVLDEVIATRNIVLELKEQFKLLSEDHEKRINRLESLLNVE